MSIRRFSLWLLVGSALLVGVLLHGTVLMTRYYNELDLHTATYIYWQERADDVAKASDYLTEQVRLYVQTGDIDHLLLYFEEAHVTRRRERALEELARNNAAPEMATALETAVARSQLLMEREFYAMKLTAVACGHEESLLPAEVSGMALRGEDADLSPEAMRAVAMAVVFEPDYELSKQFISEHTDRFLTAAMDDIRTLQSESLARLSRSVALQRVLLSLLMLALAASVGVVMNGVVRPVQVFADCLRRGRPLTVTGAAELRYLAGVYNDIAARHADIAARELILRHEAEHDPLTGVYNRNMFNRVRNLLQNRPVSLALLLVDVDYFKEVNDKYGHEAGDRVLCRIADALGDSFSSHDYLFRIGGDEFAVIVMDIGCEHADTLEQRVRQINESLSRAEDDLPPASVSVGIAFSLSGYRADLFGMADQALYRRKQLGRGGSCVFEADEAGAGG
ncbi:MAG: GGDEF domain-containing protein [Clostridia bacterium]|nr:GGDEF domain-containing protein [Clostridia bacterium]